MNKFILFALFLLLTINLAPSSRAQYPSDEYLKEFSDANETCSAIDYFVYDVSTPRLWNENHHTKTIPVFYRCCNQEVCTTLIFDVNGKIFLKNELTSELIDLNYIKYSLQNNNLSKTNFVSNGIDVCDEFFSIGDVSQETVNLASGAAETIAPLMSAERAQQINTAVRSAKAVGAVEKFNPTILIGGVVCHYNNKLLKKSVESLIDYNNYLSNIQNNYAQEGYVYSLNNQISITRTNLKEYLDSVISIVRGSGGVVLNTFWALFTTPFKENPADFKIEKTEYQIIQEIYAQIANYDVYLKNPDNALILRGQNTRLSEKTQQFNDEYAKFTEEYDNLSKVKPSYFRILFTNIFFKPNYNISVGISYFDNASDQKVLAEQQFKENRFNSAITSLSSAKTDLSRAKQEILREVQIKREFGFG